MSSPTSRSPRQLPSPPSDSEEVNDRNQPNPRPVAAPRPPAQPNHTGAVAPGTTVGGEWTVYRVDEIATRGVHPSSSSSNENTNEQLSTRVEGEWERLTAEERERFRRAERAVERERGRNQPESEHQGSTDNEESGMDGGDQTETGGSRGREGKERS